MQELMMKWSAAALAVPTNDMAVRTHRRRLGEPLTRFGEREMERRDRLRMLMARLDSKGQLEKLMKVHEEEEAATTTLAKDAEEGMVQYPFYTEGSKELLDARIDESEDEDADIDLALKQAESLSLNSSELRDDQPLSGCTISRDGEMLATCYLSLSIHDPIHFCLFSLSGVARIWRVPQVTKVSTLEGDTKCATDVAFSLVHNHLATASADQTARLWNTDGSLLKKFEDSGAELLLQEGHSRSLYGIAFDHDGSLAVSCGLDCTCLEPTYWEKYNGIGRPCQAVVGVDAEILRGLERAAINRIVLTLPERKKNVKLLFLSTVQIPSEISLLPPDGFNVQCSGSLPLRL
ncbi:hypothetical protein POTOM_052455 [Populus tomentosa]|uniref:Pre-mRNA processing factor 4 (PRP4)-like domain-containing protein n=1 Tax=Populus tomentosa TaxID=118781 RepID=A0A8X8C8Q5_POPTO|nr:hypothetical protein POTOM_052455 [Populus tomentosa]